MKVNGEENEIAMPSLNSGRSLSTNASREMHLFSPRIMNRIVKLTYFSNFGWYLV